MVAKYWCAACGSYWHFDGTEGSCRTLLRMMTNDQLNAFTERFVLSFEKIAASLEQLSETYRRHYEKLYPERKEVREAVITRVPTEEDRIREAHGAGGAPLNEWLSEVEDEEQEGQYLGIREREWLDAQKREGDHEETA